MKTVIGSASVLAALMVAGGATAQEPLTLMLNWAAGGDHAPVYYALEQGWYAEAGVDLRVVPSNGSGAAASALGVGQVELAIIDMPTALQFRSEGADIVGIFVAYNDSPYGLYWSKSSGIETAADLAGKRLGAPAFDAARQMWGPIANAIRIDPDSVEWVNIQPTAKVAALQTGAIEATTHFYSVHFIYEDVFGDDLGYALVRDYGLNPYGLTYFANGDAIEEKGDAIEAMVQVTQRAFAACLTEPEPCANALASAVSMRQQDAFRELVYAARVMPGQGNTLAIGEFDPDRVADDYAMVRASFDINEYDPQSAFTNRFIDTEIQYPR